MAFQTTLSAHEVQEFKEAFNILDKSGIGRLSIKDISDFLRSLGQIDPTDTEIKQMIAKVDIEGKGTIDYPHFLRLMEMYKMDETKETKAAFDMFGRDQSEQISADEIQRVLSRLGENLNREEVRDIINDLEKNQSGTLSAHGFSKLMRNENL